MSGNKSRRKGMAGEYEACKLWQRAGYVKCRRSFGQAREGYEQPDLIGGGIEKEFYIEVKRTKSPPTKGQIKRWLSKQIDDWYKFVKLTGFKPKPILMFRANCQDWTVLFMDRRMCWPEFNAILIAKYRSVK